MHNMQKLKNTISHTMKKPSQLVVDGDKYSPRDAEQGKKDPVHLRDVIKIYSRLMRGLDLNTPIASQENYTVQMDMIGIVSPIGLNKMSTIRSSTRDDNQKSGYDLVERNNNTSTYSTPEGHG